MSMDSQKHKRAREFPHNYAYRFHSPFGGTVIYYGPCAAEINGSHWIEVIPMYLDHRGSYDDGWNHAMDKVADRFQEAVAAAETEDPDFMSDVEVRNLLTNIFNRLLVAPPPKARGET